MDNLKQLLQEVGFTDLETTIYIALLKEKKATGYRLARLVGKSDANTYKALATLQKKGVIVIDETKKVKECSPLPIAEYFGILEESLKSKRASIEDQLKKYSVSVPQDGIYQIDQIDHVFEKAKNLIREAKHTILADIHLFPLTIFKELLEEKASDGVKVLIKTYEAIEIKGCTIVVQNSENGQFKWNCDWCDIIVDNREFLISFLKKEGQGVLQAIWSKSSYLSLVLVSMFLHEFVLGQISNKIFSNNSIKVIRSELRQLYATNLYNEQMKESYRDLLIGTKE